MSKEQEKIGRLELKIDFILKALKEANDIRKNNASIIDNNFQILDAKIDSIDKKLKSLHADTNQNFDEVKLELVKIQKTTQYDELYDNLKIVNK